MESNIHSPDAINGDVDSVAIKQYLSTNKKEMRINEGDASQISLMYKAVCDFSWLMAKGHILKHSKMVYDKKNHRLTSFANNPWWFYQLSQLHQFSGYRATPFSLDMMLMWKPCGSDFVVPFIRMGTAALRALSTTGYNFPKYSADKQAHSFVVKTLSTMAAQSDLVKNINYGFLNPEFFEIMQTCYVDELSEFMRLFAAASKHTKLQDGTNRKWSDVWDKYVKRVFKMLTPWIDAQQDGTVSAEQIQLAKELKNKMKWFLHGQVLNNGLYCPKLDTPTPFICAGFVIDLANIMTTRQWPVLRVSFFFPPPPLLS